MMMGEELFQSTLFGLPETPCAKKVKDSQGQKANKSGETAEATIYCLLKERGYGVQRQYPIPFSVYSAGINADFFVTGIPQFPKGLIIESKWQDSKGSVDEKFPYLVLNIKQYYPCPAIVVYGGIGARPGSIDFLKTQADGNKLYAVLSLEEFVTWTIRNL